MFNQIYITMKKLLLCATIAVAMCFASCEGFDASDILDRLDNLENQLDDLKGNGSDSGSDDNSGNNGGDNQGGNNDENGGENGNGSEGETVSQLNKIYYTTSDNTKLFPKTDASLYGAILISNTYKDGQGILVFDDVVTSIGYQAFHECTSLTSITIPDGAISIGDSAFGGCISLTSVTIGDSVTSIGHQAFYMCPSLTSITIPDSVTSIGSYTFYGCTSLTSITIPDSVTSIGREAFSDCTSLTSVTIPDSVTSIRSSAFKNCSSLTSITIPDSVTSIESSAFEGCTSLTRVDISDLSAWCKIAFYDSHANPLCYGEKLYLNGSELTDITIPSDFESLASFAFYGCSSLTSVTIPDSVTSIGRSVFEGCTSLKEVYCKPTTPPIFLDRSNYPPFPFNSEMKIYVPRNSYSLYAEKYYNDWYLSYKSYIKPYDFE